MKPVKSSTCVFCIKIKNEFLEELPNGVVTFIPLNPVTPGHRLFVPKRHVVDIVQSPLVTAKVMKEVARFYRNTSIQLNVITSRGTDATQSVPHFHVHVVPRTSHDGLSLPWTGQKKE